MDNTKKCHETIKNAGLFHCNLCDFTSSKESNYIKHLSTRKHKRITMDKKKNAKKCQKMPKNYHTYVRVENHININQDFVSIDIHVLL